MDILSVRGKDYPQRVVLDSDLVTITGDSYEQGTEIFVLLCEQLVICRDARSSVSNSKSNSYEKIYFHYESDELIEDIHCRNKTYANVEELCLDRPRFFSCQEQFFAMDTKDCTVKVTRGQVLELTKVDSTEKCVIKDNQMFYNNVSVPMKTSYVLHCYCKDSDSTILIPSTCKSTFKAVDDPTCYKAKSLLDNVQLPRRIKISDDNIYETGSPFLKSNFVSLESRTNNFFLLFTTEYQVSEQTSAMQLRHHVKCCELADPSTIKLRTRVDNTQIGEQVQTIFVFQTVQNGQTLYSVLGRKTSIPVSRLQTGRQVYMPMEVSETSVTHNMYSSDSGFYEPKGKGLRSLNISPERQQEDYLNVSIAEDDGEYVDVSLKGDTTPPIPERKYLEKDDSTLPPLTESDESNLGCSSNVEQNNQPKEPNKPAVVPKAGIVVGDSLNEESEVKKQTSQNIKDEKLQIQSMSSSELAEFLKSCKLSGLAETCMNEGIDGELFLDLDEEILKDEPFHLKKFEIVKVNKIKVGWTLKQ